MSLKNILTSIQQLGCPIRAKQCQRFFKTGAG
jgi:hypothetical protein